MSIILIVLFCLFRLGQGVPIETNDTIIIIPVTSPPAPIPNTPHTTLVTSSIQVEDTKNNSETPNDPPAETTPFPLSTTTENEDVWVPKVATRLRELRARNKERDGVRRGSRRRNSRNRHDDPEEGGAEKFLHRVVGLGTKLLARSFQFVTGHKNRKDGDSSEENEDSVRGHDYEKSAPGHKRTSKKKGAADEDESINSKWKDFNPVQFVTERYNMKRSKMQRWREVKDDFRKKELDRKVEYFADSSGNFITKNVRNVMQHLINRYEKNTETLQLWVDYRRQKLQTFVSIPMINSILNGSKGKNDSEEDYGSAEKHHGHDDFHPKFKLLEDTKDEGEDGEEFNRIKRKYRYIQKLF